VSDDKRGGLDHAVSVMERDDLQFLNLPPAGQHYQR
jgi:hypothetical protein